MTELGQGRFEMWPITALEQGESTPHVKNVHRAKQGYNSWQWPWTILPVPHMIVFSHWSGLLYTCSFTVFGEFSNVYTDM